MITVCYCPITISMQCDRGNLLLSLTINNACIRYNTIEAKEAWVLR